MLSFETTTCSNTHEYVCNQFQKQTYEKRNGSTTTNRINRIFGRLTQPLRYVVPQILRVANDIVAVSSSRTLFLGTGRGGAGHQRDVFCVSSVFSSVMLFEVFVGYEPKSTDKRSTTSLMTWPFEFGTSLFEEQLRVATAAIANNATGKFKIYSDCLALAPCSKNTKKKTLFPVENRYFKIHNYLNKIRIVRVGALINRPQTNMTSPKTRFSILTPDVRVSHPSKKVILVEYP